MPLRSLLLTVAVVISVAIPGAPLLLAAEQTPELPGWLRAHVGTGEGQIAPIVLQRARALYWRKVSEGAVKNPCYLSMDATRPSAVAQAAELGRRFYIICEADQIVPRGFVGLWQRPKTAAREFFANGRQCAKNFSNAEGSKLTTGGAYVTAEDKDVVQRLLPPIGQEVRPSYRTFLLFDGEGDTANARERAIGGHPAVGFLKWRCRYKNPKSPYADEKGYVPYGEAW